MSTDETRFRELRARFHELVECPEPDRAGRLAAIAAAEPELAAALTELLAHADPADLVAPGSWLPAEVGPFAVGALLGRGGMGEVRIGERIAGGFTQRVALKLLKPLVHAPSLHQRFLRERQVLARLEHPHIARLVDGGLHGQSLPWLAMELVDGQDLGTWMRTTRPTLRARISLLAQVARAVAFAHRQLVVHRDLKPANIRVTPDGTPKLLDFGLAKLLDDPATDAWSRFGTAMTPRYAAPEQILGERIDTATDVHALGVLGFELVAGRSPFEPQPDASGADPESQAAWSTRIVAGARADLRRSLASAPLAPAERAEAARFLPSILGTAMARDRDARYPSASALADDLDDWLAGRPPRSGIGSRRERVLAFARRHRVPIVFAGAALAGMLGLTVVALQQALNAREQARRADHQARALLDVLAAASPEHFAGQDPRASEFLADAARRIAGDPAQDDGAARRALTQIGVGLVNLGHPQAAGVTFEQAWARAEQDPETTADHRLDLLKLMALVLDTDAADARARRDVLHERLARQVGQGGDPGLETSAMAALGAAFAKAGDAGRAHAWFRCCPTTLGTSSPGMSLHARESALRQKGIGLLALGEAGGAVEAFAASLALIEQDPGSFPSLRLAEARIYLAEAAIDLGRPEMAEAELVRAEPAVFAEYPPGHDERVRLQGLRALAAAWRQAPRDADSEAIPGRTGQQVAVLDRANAGDCAGARTLLATLVPATLRQQQQQARIEARLAAVCPGD